MDTYTLVFVSLVVLFSGAYLYLRFYDPVQLCQWTFNLERVYEYDNLLTPQECQLLIQRATPLIKRSDVSAEEKYDKIRTSSHVFLPTDDPVTRKIDSIVYHTLGIPPSHYEELQVVNYKSTQKYGEHWDACIRGDICQKELERFGSHRYATFLIYLNEGFEGGETDFPKKNKQVKPVTGKGALFFNLNNTYDNIRETSLHAGLPPKTGEKWMCNKWIRVKPIL